jgi:hypothetical protein
MTGYWIGVASRDHVRCAVVGGFCQLCHGKAAPLRRLKPGDRIVYYSPREQMRDREVVQAFTAIGEIAKGEAYPFDMGGGFVPYRRAVQFHNSLEAPIRPLLPRLSFTQDRRDWGMIFRRGVFPIGRVDYEMIACAMRATPMGYVEAMAK